jgi:predicted lactoylglutathione lyase
MTLMRPPGPKDMSERPFIVSLPTQSRRAAFEFYRDGMGFETVGELAADGIPEPLQIAISEHARIMLVPTVGFGWVTGEHQTAEPGTSECMLVLPVESDDEVDAVIERARRAGAEIVTEPGPQPWGYSGAFADLDGHLWMVRTGLQ